MIHGSIGIIAELIMMHEIAAAILTWLRARTLMRVLG
jgi:hypothetical protein